MKARIKRRLMPTAGVRRMPFGVARGLRLHIDFVSQTHLYLGLYEIELNARLRELCLPGAHVFDVGGSVGYDALVLARLSQRNGAAGTVITFECDEAVLPVLSANLRANPIGQAVTLVPRAVGSGVPYLTLDEAVRLYGAPDFVKIDIEGAEADALLGGTTMLTTVRPSLLIEVHGLEVEAKCRQLLREYGYAWDLVCPRRLVPDYRPMEHNRWLIAQPRA